jgi:plasmid stabilization system protein ParE
LEEIVAFAARRSAERAAELNARLLASARRLERLPLLGRVVPEFKLEHLRELIEPPHRILYVVRGDSCSVVAVFHSSRDVANLFRPENLEGNGADS